MATPAPPPTPSPRPPATGTLQAWRDALVLLIAIFAVVFAVCAGLAAALAFAVTFAIGTSAPDLRWIIALFVVPFAYGVTLLLWVPRMHRRHADHALLVRRIAEVLFVLGMIGFGLALKRL